MASAPPDAAVPSGGLLAGVVDPWTWPRARDATDRERALEDVGPYEPLDPAQPGSPLCNPNARYWTKLVGLAWDRDLDLDVADVPVDLDGDGHADTRVTRHVHAPGGVLANLALFGLTATPDDPRGRVGRISVSTGVLGLREPLLPDGKPSGEIGMTCFLCHGGADPGDGHVVLGMAGTRFDYGLLLATAAALNDDGPAADFRRAHGFPDGPAVRARLLLAGPGRQDLTGEFGLDVTVPGLHSARYPGTRRVRQGTKGIVNPISVPPILPWAGMDLQNWSGSEVASARWVRRLLALGGDANGVLRQLGLPAMTGADPRGWSALRRALLLDLRNLGTLGLQQDSFPGLLWADAIHGNATLAADALVAIPPMYVAAPLRRVIERERFVAPPADAAAIARGRELFANRVIGVIANRQILKEAPALYGPAKLTAPLLAPIDEALPATFAVRCADCHSATPGGEPVPFATATPPLGRCGHCHRSHAPFEDEDRPRASLAALHVPPSAPAEVAFCQRCHTRHRAFTPVVYSSSLLLPFDANVNGKAQDDEDADGRAGGIGTEALLAFDVPRPERPASGFGVDVTTLARVRSVGAIETTHLGVGWVRVPPLAGVRASAPYLHNGSVPTLRALLEPARRRPATFALGAAGFTFDTRLPGNRNIGHEFGTALSSREKDDLIAFLESL
ncbi:MAG TPA: cytochrome c3 family protein [Polyangia bacterium]